MYAIVLFVALLMALALAAPEIHHDGTTKGVTSHGVCVRSYIPRSNTVHIAPQSNMLSISRAATNMIFHPDLY
jgi:hypothetical protein